MSALGIHVDQRGTHKWIILTAKANGMLVNLLAVVDVGQGSAGFESKREGELVRVVGGGGEQGGVEAEGVVEMAVIGERADHEVVEIRGWIGDGVEEEVGGVDETERNVSEGE